MNGEQCWGVMSRDFPRDVREELLRGVIAGYPNAAEAVASFTPETADWLQPLQCHAIMRDTMLSIARRFPGLKADARETKPPTTTYVVLGAGQSELTVARVHEPREMPRWAKHRTTLAGSINFELFGDGAGQFMYGILLCGPDVTFGPIDHVPAFVDIGIPARDYEAYVHYWPLYEEFPETVERVSGVRPAQINDALVQLRRAAAENIWGA